MADTSDRAGLRPPKDAAQLLDLYFLEIRSHLLEAASAFDRIERAAGGKEAMKDPRMVSLFKALEKMGEPGAGRAKGFLQLFSEPE
ncbi:MAG: hypothetical protein ACYTG7_07745 [Planctomycetota bacterium]|jgi:hypothetical protein